MTTPVVLGIDPGRRRCGWSVLADGQHESGVWHLPKAEPGKPGLPYAALRAHVSGTIEAFAVRMVAVEDVKWHSGTGAAHVYGGLVAVIGMVALEYGLWVEGVPVSHVKKAATGKGNAKKAEIVAAARERWGVEITDDEADARFVAEAAVGGGKWRQP